MEQPNAFCDDLRLGLDVARRRLSRFVCLANIVRRGCDDELHAPIFEIPHEAQIVLTCHNGSRTAMFAGSALSFSHVVLCRGEGSSKLVCFPVFLHEPKGLSTCTQYAVRSEIESIQIHIGSLA